MLYTLLIRHINPNSFNIVLYFAGGKACGIMQRIYKRGKRMRGFSYKLLLELINTGN